MTDVVSDAPTVARPRRLSPWAWMSGKSPVIVTILALLLGLIVGAIVITTTTPAVLDAWRGLFHSWGAPGHAVKITFDNVGAAYRTMFEGSIISPPNFWHSLSTGKGWTTALTPLSETLTYAAPLLIASIGVGIAFQTGMFNIGANGQAVLGGITGAVVGSMLHMPMVLHLPLTLLAGIGGGMLAGSVPGLLKAFTGAHEVIVTIMFNYVMYAFLFYVVLSTPFQQPGQQNDISRTIDPSAQLAPLFGSSSGLRVNYGIFVAAAVVLFAWWFLDRSSMGFDFRVTGANPSAARASGMNAKAVTVYVFLISGGLAGLAGIVKPPAPPISLMVDFSLATPVSALPQLPWRCLGETVQWALSGRHSSSRRSGWVAGRCKPRPEFHSISRRSSNPPSCSSSRRRCW